jgi:hypothetical protein
MNYVELNRCFVNVVEDQIGFDARSRAAWDEALERRTGWPELLQSARHVVILGEAGAGKTTELRTQAGRMAGFFVRIEELAERGLAPALEVGAQYLDEWRRSATDGWFFLDSVDEAHLRGRRFDAAIRRLATELGSAAARARVVASCRASDWRVHADKRPLEELAKQYRAPLHGDQARTDAKDATIRVVELAPLTRPQAFSLLIRKKQVTERDANAFLEAIDAAGAEKFMDRPGDVTWMFAYWQKHGRIGSISELIEENVNQRLLEENAARKSSLSRERLRRGAEALAAACVLCQKAAIRVPNEEPLPRDAIAPEAVLNDWSRDEIREFLALPLFDEGTYGRVRYHHRSVCEYLAARWLARLLTLGCPQREIEDVLFPSTYAKRKIVPAPLKPVVGWLARDHQWIRDLTIELAPETLMGEGDPGALSTMVRARILKAVAASDGRAPDRPVAAGDALARFADPVLADMIRNLCEDRDTGWLMRCELLLMIRWGQLDTCIDLTFRIALDETENEYVRMVAIDAVYALGGAEERAELEGRARSEAGAQMPDRVFSRIIVHCLPEPRDVDALVDLLAQVGERISRSDAQHDVIRHIDRRCPPERRPALLDGLVGILRSSLTDSGWLSDAHEWLLKRAVKLFQQLLADDNIDTALPVLARFDNFIFSCDDRYFHSRPWVLENIDESLRERPDLTRRLFWWLAAEARKERPDELVLDRVTPWRRLWGAFAHIQWLFEDMERQRESWQRHLAFRTLCRYSNLKLGEHDYVLERLLRAVSHDEVWRRELEASLAEPPEEILARWRHEEVQFAQTRLVKKEREQQEQQQEREGVRASIEQIRSGTHTRILSSLLKKIRQAEEDSEALAVKDLRPLAEFYGVEVAEAARAGFSRFWRIHAPPSAGGGKNTIPGEVSIGLTGLAVEMAGGLDIARMTDDDATRAVRYAMWDLQWPDWLDALASAHRTVVRDALLSEIEVEFQANSKEWFRVLEKLAQGTHTVRECCVPGLQDLMERVTPASASALSLATQTLLCSSTTERARLALLSCERAQASLGMPAHLSWWWIMWFETSAEQALRFLETLDQEHRDDGRLAKILSTLWKWIQRVWGQEFLLEAKPDLVLRLAALAYKHLPPTEPHTAARHGPSPYGLSSYLRDRLATTHTETGYRALQHLANEPDAAAHREDLLRRAETCARDDACQPWREHDIHNFAEQHERTPQTAGDLLQIARGRLDDIRRDVEGSDFSIRSLFQKGTDETEVQRWLAHELRLRALRKYTVEREPEVFNGKKPDIRLHYPTTGPVVIELKVACKWTCAELEDALVNQLVGQYLRDARSRHGILVLAYVGAKRSWRLERGRRVAFQQLVKHLEAHAKHLLTDRAVADELCVEAIDLTSIAPSSPVGNSIGTSRLPLKIARSTRTRPRRVRRARRRVPTSSQNRRALHPRPRCHACVRPRRHR